jgi:hypothetical protein
MRALDPSRSMLVITVAFILTAWTLVIVSVTVILPHILRLKAPWSIVVLAWVSPLLALGGPHLWRRMRSLVLLLNASQVKRNRSDTFSPCSIAGARKGSIYSVFIKARLRTIHRHIGNRNWPIARRHVRTLLYGLTHWMCLTCGRYKGASGSHHCSGCRLNLQ